MNFKQSYRSLFDQIHPTPELIADTYLKLFEAKRLAKNTQTMEKILPRRLKAAKSAKAGIFSLTLPARYSALLAWAGAFAVVCLLCGGLYYLGTQPIFTIPFSPITQTEQSTSIHNSTGIDIQADRITIVTPLTPGVHQSTVALSSGTLRFVEPSDDNPISIDRAKLIDPEGGYRRSYTLDQLIARLGRDPRPGWLPQDLVSPYREEDLLFQVTYSKDGTVFYENNVFTYQPEGYNPEEYIPDLRELHIETAKGRPPFQCGIYLAEEEIKSTIGGVSILAGHCKSGYGPYDAETHTPSGYNDIYFSEFTVDGIGYYVLAQNLTQEEFIRVLISMIEPE